MTYKGLVQDNKDALGFMQWFEDIEPFSCLSLNHVCVHFHTLLPKVISSYLGACFRLKDLPFMYIVGITDFTA